MREYHKIQTVYLRNPETKFKTLLEGQWAEPEFAYLADNEWVWTEKIDGTNMRVMWDGQRVSFGGKTDKATPPPFLLDAMAQTFTVDKMVATFNTEPQETCLYGEGYGARIQKGGGGYIPDGVGFILFDVHIGNVWLESSNVDDIAGKLSVDRVPVVGKGPLVEAVGLAREGFDSLVGKRPSEGLVMRPTVELLTRTGRRVITKIKHKDFRD